MSCGAAGVRGVPVAALRADVDGVVHARVAAGRGAAGVEARAGGALRGGAARGGGRGGPLLLHDGAGYCAASAGTVKR